MHDSGNGTHSATAAETLVLTNNMVYSEPSTYFDVININHHHHHNHHHHNYLDDHIHLNHIHHQSLYHDNQYNHDSPSNVDLSNSHDLSLFQNQNLSEDEGHSMQTPPEHQLDQHQDAHSEQQPSTHPYSQSNSTNSISSTDGNNSCGRLEESPLVEPQPQQTSCETHLIDDLMIEGKDRQDSSDHDGTRASEHVAPPQLNISVLEISNEKPSIVEVSSACVCNTDSNVTPDVSSTSPSHVSPPHDCQNHLHLLDGDSPSVKAEINEKAATSYKSAEQEDDELVDDDDDDDDDNADEEDDDEEEEDDDDEEEEDDEDDDDNDEDDDNDDEDESEDDIVDPGQHCQLIQPAHNEINSNLIERDESREGIVDILDGERMLEVTRKLVRNTERDPDRDLRKQVLLKTAIKKLPHFMEYNRYSDSLDRNFHSNMSPQAYYEHHDSQQRFYHSVQPNAIQMSTTSLRMLDLNDDHDPELNNIEHERPDPNLGYRAGLDQHDYDNQQQFDRRYQQRTHDLNHYETGSPMISRHNSLDNLYQPINGGDINEDMKDTDERVPIAFQIACEIYDFTCAPDDNERKLLDNLTNGYYPRPTKEPKTNTNDSDNVNDARDQDGGSDTSSSSQSSSSDESANSISPLIESGDANSTSLLEASLNSSSEFYHSSHDSGVALFSLRSNKRSSSSIGLDDEMEIDHLTELSTRGSGIVSNNQYKKLRKREIID